MSPDSKLMVVSLKAIGNALERSLARELFALPAPEGGYSYSVYDVSADGQRILVAQPQPTSQTLTVIVNWPALLRKGAPAP